MWWIDTDNVISVRGLRNVITQDYVNTATVTGILYALPALHPEGSAVDKGAGAVGIPCTAHGLAADESIRIERTKNYNGEYIVVGITANEIIINATYRPETFTGDEFIYKAIVGRVGAPITFTYETASNGNYNGKIPSDAPLLQEESYMLCICEVSEGEQVLAKVFARASFQGL